MQTLYVRPSTRLKVWLLRLAGNVGVLTTGNPLVVYADHVALAWRAAMPHKYKIGQAVVLARPSFGPREVYEIVRLMPTNEAGDPQYRLRAIATGAERVAAERDLWPA